MRRQSSLLIIRVVSVNYYCTVEGGKYDVWREASGKAIINEAGRQPSSQEPALANKTSKLSYPYKLLIFLVYYLSTWPAVLERNQGLVQKNIVSITPIAPRWASDLEVWIL